MSMPRYVPVQKGNRGAFTCLGNWYDLDCEDSMDSLKAILKMVRGPRDLHTAIEELVDAASNTRGEA